MVTPKYGNGCCGGFSPRFPRPLIYSQAVYLSVKTQNPNLFYCERLYYTIKTKVCQQRKNVPENGHALQTETMKNKTENQYYKGI